MLKKLAPCLKGYWRQTILAPVMITGEVIIELFIPYLMAQIIDVGIASGDIGYILRVGGLMVALALLSMACGGLSGVFSAVAATGFARQIREKLFNKVQDFSFANVDRFSTASLITRLTTDVTNLQNAFMMVTRIAVRAPVMLVSAAIMAFRTNARLSVVFLVAMPLLILPVALISVKAHPRFESMLGKIDRLNASIQEDLVGIRVVKAFVREDYEREKFDFSADEVMNAQRKAEKLVTLNQPLMQFVMYGCLLAVCWFGGQFIIGGSMGTGAFFSFMSYMMQTLMSVMMVAMICVMMVLSMASLRRIVEVLDEEIDIKNESTDTESPKNGAIDFDHVNFSYARDAQNLTLEDIDLHIASGETIGIIGGTGSAKTTLVQLIPRLYDVFSGSVRVGGRDVREYDPRALRESVSMVLQKNVLFSGTIRENLRWGNENASDAELEQACKAACAHDFIMSFPNGYDTDLGQGGVNVSGGQKQRLCIARALLKNPRIIILDDSTSAVDTATDAAIRQAFRENLADTTTIIIAQRITSVMDADRIVVLEDGKINDVGTHDELMARNEIYRDVYQSQQKGAQ